MPRLMRCAECGKVMAVEPDASPRIRVIYNVCFDCRRRIEQQNRQALLAQPI